MTASGTNFRSEVRANILATLVAVVIFGALVYGAGRLLAEDDFPYPDQEDIREYCENQAAKRASPDTHDYAIRRGDCVHSPELERFGS